MLHEGAWVATFRSTLLKVRRVTHLSFAVKRINHKSRNDTKLLSYFINNNDSIRGCYYLVIPGRDTIDAWVFLQHRDKLTEVIHNVNSHIKIFFQNDHVFCRRMSVECFTNEPQVVL